MTVDDTRHANLIALISRYGGQRVLADAIGKAPAQVSQWVTRAPNERGTPRVMSTATARQIESRLGLAPGWMDANHDGLPDPAPPAAAAPPAVDSNAFTPDERATLNSFDDLRKLTTPRSRASLDAIQRAASEGRLTEADLVLLRQIAERFMGG